MSTIDGILLVNVEPVGRPEHGEEENHEGFKSDGFVESNQFALPAGVLHQDNASAVRSNDI
jgi:hypothetical protein